jgi:phage gp36-like protein
VAYLTPDELRAILDPEGDDDDPGNAGRMSDTQLQEAIDDAAAEVDGRLANRTTVPLATPLPPLLFRIVRDIAAYLATLTDRQSEPLNPTDPVVLRNTAAERLLDGLSAGAVALPPGLSPTVYAPAEAAVENVYDGQMMTPGDGGMSRFGDVWYPGGPRYGYGFGRF